MAAGWRWAAAALAGLAAAATAEALARALPRQGEVRSRVRAGACRMHARHWPGPGVPGRPPVVLVHGLGMSGLYMVPLAVLLARDFAVHAPDLPGFGRSGRPRRALSVPEMADALALWLAAAGIGGRVVLLGNSLGCEIILAFAERHSERVARLVLQGPTPDPAARPAAMQMARFLLAPLHERLSILPVALFDYLRAGIPRYARTFGHMMAHEVEDSLARVAAPALVVLGTSDYVVPRAWAARMARRLPRGRLVLVPGAAHGMTWSHPRAFRDAILPWLLAEEEFMPASPMRNRIRAGAPHGSANRAAGITRPDPSPAGPGAATSGR